MADPQIKSPMDPWDIATVIIYRCGFVIAGVGSLLLPWDLPLALKVILVGAVCCASSLHLYLKSYRLIFQFAVWLALLCILFNWPLLALGGALLTLGGLSFKEYFCFRVPLLNLQPLFVAALWFAVFFAQPWLVGILAVIVGVLLLLLAVQKWRMPLHFDIGDKSKYQI